MLTIGWFSTGRGPGSRKLLAAATNEIASGRLDARIPVVFCNREPGEDENTDLFLDQVRVLIFTRFAIAEDRKSTRLNSSH